MFGYEFIYEMNLDKDQIYWLFSSSSQSIAAFIALLLTGYAFVVNVMDNLEVRDETLAEVHADLKSTYYVQLRRLAITGGFTIIASFIMIFVNHYSNWVRSVLLLPAAIGVLATIVMGVRFIIEIVDPKKYVKKASALLREEEKSVQKEGVEISIGQFMNSFIKLEIQLRELYDQLSAKPTKSMNIYRQQPPRSLVEIVNLFYKNKLITTEEMDLVKEVVKTRNLVVHGQQTEIDNSWLKRLAKCSQIINEVGKRLHERRIQENIYRLEDRLGEMEDALHRHRDNVAELEQKLDNATEESIKERYISRISETKDKIDRLEVAINQMHEKIEHERSKLAERENLIPGL